MGTERKLPTSRSPNFFHPCCGGKRIEFGELFEFYYFIYIYILPIKVLLIVDIFFFTHRRGNPLGIGNLTRIKNILQINLY